MSSRNESQPNPDRLTLLIIFFSAITGNLAWFTDDIKTQDDRKMSSQAANTLIQLVQLREALGSALRDPPDEPNEWCDEECAERQARAVGKVGINRWGDHMLGMEAHMLDA